MSQILGVSGVQGPDCHKCAKFLLGKEKDNMTVFLARTLSKSETTVLKEKSQLTGDKLQLPPR